MCFRLYTLSAPPRLPLLRPPRVDDSTEVVSRVLERDLRSHGVLHQRVRVPTQKNPSPTPVPRVRNWSDHGLRERLLQADGIRLTDTEGTEVYLGLGSPSPAGTVPTRSSDPTPGEGRGSPRREVPREPVDTPRGPAPGLRGLPVERRLSRRPPTSSSVRFGPGAGGAP